jgi:hypothetical protein
MSKWGLQERSSNLAPTISTINPWMAEHSPNPVIFPHLQSRGVEAGSDRVTVLEEEERRLDSAGSSSSPGALDDRDHPDFIQHEAANSSIESSSHFYTMSTCDCPPVFQGTSSDMHQNSCSMARIWQAEKGKTRLVPSQSSCLSNIPRC